MKDRVEGGCYLALFSGEGEDLPTPLGGTVDLHVSPEEAEELKGRVPGAQDLRVALKEPQRGKTLLEFWLIPLEGRGIEGQVIQCLDQGLLILDDGGKAILANPKMAQLLGLNSAEELLGGGWKRALPKDLRRRLEKALKEERFTFEGAIKGTPVVVSGVPLEIKDRPTGAIVLFVDISPLKIKERELASKVRELEDTKRAMLHLLEEMEETKKKLERLSITDELTGLYNRRHFYRILAREMEVASKYRLPLSLIIMDLDDFKDYNDTHGHVEGDKALKRFAEVVQNSIRKGIDSAYRLGGDEFAVIAPGSNYDQATRIGERIQQGVRDLSLSLGIAQFAEGMDTDSFISQADKRMYEEKRRKKANSH